MTASLCITVRRWPGRLIKVIIIMLIAVVDAAVARWDPAAAVPLIAGLSLGAGALACMSRAAAVA